MCLIKSRVLKTRFLLCKNRVFKTRDLHSHFKPTKQFTTTAKRVYKTRFLIESRVFKTRDVTFLKTFKRCLTYYFESLLTASNSANSLSEHSDLAQIFGLRINDLINLHLLT